MKLDTKLSTKYYSNTIQQHAKWIIHLNQAKFVPGIKDGSKCENQSM